MQGQWEALVNGNGAWEREARRLATVAGIAYVVLNAERLISYDVRDLQALNLRLRRKHRLRST